MENGQQQDVFVTPDSSGSADDDGGGGGEWVAEPTDSDVLCGRGGSINSHPGNERFRNLVERRKRVYLTARFKREKRLIASSIVNEIRNLDPPGRFLSRDAKTNKWRDIGDEKARDKTSQALRENAPTIRAEIETEIKEQRAEMQRAEEEEMARGGTAAAQHEAYYGQGWGYYYGYGGPPPPGPPPPQQQQQPQPPPPPHPHGHGQHPPTPPPHPPPPSGYYEGQWGLYPPQPPQHYVGSGGGGGQHHYPPPKSALEETADMVMSSAESIKSYFAVGGTSTSAAAVKPSSSNDGHGSAASVHSKPIMYVHDSKRRRIVKFRDDTFTAGERRHRRRQAPPLPLSSSSGRAPSSYSSGVHSTASNSLADDPDDAADIEPEDINTVGEQNSSLMAQMANQILSSIGSWDASTIVCGHDTADERVPFPKAQAPEPEEEMEQIPEEDLTVEWEGQEVLLMAENDDCSGRESSPERMPPPVARRSAHVDAVSSFGGFSSIGSCSWLPDTASMFSGSKQGIFAGGGGVSPVASMDMEYSTGGRGGGAPHHHHNHDNYSTGGGSIGGGSLTNVFENEVADADPAPVSMGSPSMSHRALQQVPSWERSLRSKSPLSLASDDGSMISKSSSKISESGMSSPAAASGNHAASGDDGMLWETTGSRE